MQYIPSAQFIAGTEPTTSVLSFALLYMVREPEVQDRVRAEIHDVLGTSRFPESSDRQDLPFTEATIMEIQRMANVTPRGLLPHSNMGGPVKVLHFTRLPSTEILDLLSPPLPLYVCPHF